MSTATKQPVDLKQQASPPPPHIIATYQGTYYEKTNGGYKYIPFTRTVKWPLSAVTNENFHPVALFKKYKERKMMQKVGGAGIREIFLVKTEGDLPSIPDLEHRLWWTSQYEDLVKLAESLGSKKYVHVDLKDEKRTQHSVSIAPALYPDPVSLRAGIRLFLSEPEAFDREQKKLQEKDANAPKHMESEIAALADFDE